MATDKPFIWTYKISHMSGGLVRRNFCAKYSSWDKVIAMVRKSGWPDMSATTIVSRILSNYVTKVLPDNEQAHEFGYLWVIADTSLVPPYNGVGLEVNDDTTGPANEQTETLVIRRAKKVFICHDATSRRETEGIDLIKKALFRAGIKQIITSNENGPVNINGIVNCDYVVIAICNINVNKIPPNMHAVIGIAVDAGKKIYHFSNMPVQSNIYSQHVINLRGDMGIYLPPCLHACPNCRKDVEFDYNKYPGRSSHIVKCSCGLRFSGETEEETIEGWNEFCNRMKGASQNDTVCGFSGRQR